MIPRLQAGTPLGRGFFLKPPFQREVAARPEGSLSKSETTLYPC